MKIKNLFKPSVIFLLCVLTALTACIKNNDLIEGQSKIRFHNMAVGTISQDFFLDSVRYAPSIAYGSSSAYIVVPGNRTYSVLSKNTGRNGTITSLKQALKVGSNYSVFFAKKSATDSLLYFFEDDLKSDTTQGSKLLFLNLGYTLKSKVVLRDSLKSINQNLGYGEKTPYVFIKFNNKNPLYVNLVDSADVIDTIKASNFYKGKVYTILFDGSKTGKLQTKIIANN